VLFKLRSAIRAAMLFDALTLAAVVDELRAALIGGRVQRVRLTGPLGVALEVFAHGRRCHLLLSAHPQFARVQLTATRPSRGVEGETRLLLLLRKYVLGGRIVTIEQPDLERVVILSIVKGPQSRNMEGAPPDGDDTDDWEPLDSPEPLHSELVVETMERRANIVLVGDDNIILDSIRHVTPTMSRRPVAPHEPYELPPRQDKRDPRRATPEGLRALAAGQPGADLARALVGAYRGLSPLAAREAVFRATGAADTALGPDLPWTALALALRGLWELPWQPCLAHSGEGPLAYAPYRLTHLPNVAPQPSISAALDAFYAAREGLASHQQRRAALAAALGESRARLERQRDQLTHELKQVAELDRLRWEGEMILGFMHTLAPGQTALEVEGRRIALDPARTPLENAQERFRAYDKARGARAQVPERLRETEARLAGLDELLALLALAEGYEAIEQIGREAEEAGYLRPPPGRRPKMRRQPPLRVVSEDGLAIFVGRSAGQNAQVTFTIGAADDLWLHARGRPGAHVLVKSGGADVPERTLVQAAGLAAWFSAARGDAAVEVDVARRRLVRRVPGGPPGLVSYRAERTLRVAPRGPDEKHSGA
jgi:predicted ribosome quality control (RQC) complex YloA/Tae2 family protein